MSKIVGYVECFSNGQNLNAVPYVQYFKFPF